MRPAACGSAGSDPVGLLHERQPLPDGLPEVGVDDSMRYIGTPFRISLSGVPQPAGKAVPTTGRMDGEVKMPETLAISGVSTLPTSVDRAKQEAEALLRQCREHVAAGRAGVILDLLDLNPEFIQHAWVRETYIRLSEERRLRRAPGRPIGRDKVCPMVVVGLVGHLIDSGRVKNPRAGIWQARGTALADLTVAWHLLPLRQHPDLSACAERQRTRPGSVSVRSPLAQIEEHLHIGRLRAGLEESREQKTRKG